MYIRPLASPVNVASVGVSNIVWTFLVYLIDILGGWFQGTTSLSHLLHQIFEVPAEWANAAIRAGYYTFCAHPQPIHILSWSIFFGPIIVLVPLLLLHEIIIICLFIASFASHGLIPGSLDDQYGYLTEKLSDSRESLFAHVDRGSTVYNKLTTEYLPLMVLRLVAAVLGLYILVGIWSGW